MVRETALITGASAGIGRALAAEFAAGGYDPILVARREDRLRAVADELADRHGGEPAVVVQDLAEPESAAELYETAIDRGFQVDALVNNVGMGTQGRFVDVDPDREAAQLGLNVVTPTQLAKRFGQDMVERGTGQILNVASTAAFQPGPYMAVYYASKAYMLSFSEAIAEELRADGVTVTALCPGPVDTEFQERAQMTDTPLARGQMQDVETVARAGYEGLQAGKTVVIPGVRYRILASLAGLVPRPVTRKLAARLNRSR